MQKRIIALAIAGSISVPAFAQSNVTVYGLVDMGYLHQGDSNPRAGNNVRFGSRNAIDNSIQSGSRLGFRGTEDIGNGLKASFVLEMGINVDTGTSGQGGLAFGRQAFLALSGNAFGTVSAGRQYTPQFSFFAAVDPFGGGFTGPVSTGLGTSDVYDVVGAGGRADNLLIYTSPSLGGLTVTGGYTRDLNGNELPPVKTPNAADGREQMWGITPVYRNGPIVAGVNYHQTVANFNSPAIDQRTTSWDVGGTYDFGVAKVHAMWGRDDRNSGAGNVDKTKWIVGASAPVGSAGKVLARYARATQDNAVAGASDLKASQWALGYTHNLSKRTNLYTAYSKFNTNTAADGFFGFSASATGPAYQRGFAAGVRHSF